MTVKPEELIPGTRFADIQGHEAVVVNYDSINDFYPRPEYVHCVSANEYLGPDQKASMIYRLSDVARIIPAPLTKEELLKIPGTRFRSEQFSSYGVCVVTKPDGNFMKPDFVCAVAETAYNGPNTESSMVFLVSEISEIVASYDPDKNEAKTVLSYIVTILERENCETHANWLKSYVETL